MINLLRLLLNFARFDGSKTTPRAHGTVATPR